MYNLGNVYHAKGKHIGRVGQQDPGEFPEDVRACLQQAVHYYELVFIIFHFMLYSECFCSVVAISLRRIVWVFYFLQAKNHIIRLWIWERLSCIERSYE